MRGLAPMVRDLAAGTPDTRERSADLWRALAICLVVLGRWFVIAVTYQNGELSGYNALGVLTWLDPVTWLFQVMPIFFLVGGYASAASLASHRASGGDGIATGLPWAGVLSYLSGAAVLRLARTEPIWSAATR